MLPHTPTSLVGHEALPGRVFWPADTARACLGAVPGAEAEALGRGGVSRACAPVHNVLLRAPTGKPSSSPEQGSLFSFFIIFPPLSTSAFARS